LAEAKKKAEEERLAAEATPTPVSVLPGSAERVASELELRAQHEQALKALRENLEKEHAQAVENLNEEHKRLGEAARSELERERNAQLEAVRKEAEAELEALRERLEGEKDEELRRLEEEKREELQRLQEERAAECEKRALEEKGLVERERKEALEGARAELAAQLEELSRTKEEQLEGARKRVEEERAAEEARLREAMEEEIAEKVKKDKKRRLEEEKKKEAELKKEMKVGQIPGLKPLGGEERRGRAGDEVEGRGDLILMGSCSLALVFEQALETAALKCDWRFFVPQQSKERLTEARQEVLFFWCFHASRALRFSRETRDRFSSSGFLASILRSQNWFMCLVSTCVFSFSSSQLASTSCRRLFLF
jgi:hypothetical protein